jgi:hypothetical protein
LTPRGHSDIFRHTPEMRRHVCAVRNKPYHKNYKTSPRLQLDRNLRLWWGGANERLTEGLAMKIFGKQNLQNDASCGEVN